VSDDFQFDGEFLMFAVGLTKSTGGGTMVTPMASSTDGLLDLCIVEAMTRREFASVAMMVKKGDHVGHPKVHYKQLRNVTIDAPEPLSVNVDGENSIGRRFTYRARPRDLWVHVAHLPGEG
jgi:diacylglycerol kinase (ATP)